MQPQQMAMEVQVLRGQVRALKEVNDNLIQELQKAKAQAAGAQVFETLLTSAVTGYASQPRAASNPFWQRDDATGKMVPLLGGPEWVIDQAHMTMGLGLNLLQGTFQAPDESHEAPSDAVAQTVEESKEDSSIKIE